jgi:hypothetical protein
MPGGGLRFVVPGLIGTVLAAGQLSQMSQQAGPGPATKDGKVRVYVYRNAGITGKEFRPSVFVDEKDTARLQSGRSVILALPAGTHIFRSTDKKEQFQIDLKPGQKYFVRIDVSVVSLKGRGKLNVVLPEEGMPEFAQTTPADSSMLKDRSMVAPEFVGK